MFDTISSLTSQNSKPDSLLKMEEECKFDKTPLSANKDKFSFTMSQKKMLGYVLKACELCGVETSSDDGALPLLLPPGFLTLSLTSISDCPVMFLCRSKTIKPPSGFGSLQTLKEDKSKPVRDEYEYVSDEGELKIDEFPIRRKKNTVKRDLSCECSTIFILLHVYCVIA